MNTTIVLQSIEHTMCSAGVLLRDWDERGSSTTSAESGAASGEARRLPVTTTEVEASFEVQGLSSTISIRRDSGRPGDISTSSWEILGRDSKEKFEARRLDKVRRHTSRKRTPYEWTPKSKLRGVRRTRPIVGGRIRWCYHFLRCASTQRIHWILIVITFGETKTWK